MPKDQVIDLYNPYESLFKYKSTVIDFLNSWLTTRSFAKARPGYDQV
ncbi:MAG: hypothetical protein AAF380_03490 [Bacteroidota bacterium]